MKTEIRKNLNGIIDSIIEESVDSKVKVGRNDLAVKLTIKPFIRKHKLEGLQVDDVYFELEKACRQAKVWKDTRSTSVVKDSVQMKVRKFIASLDEVKGNILTLEDGTTKIVDVIFKKGLTKEQEKTRKEMTA
tara:strand:- start:2455 stop:2853 length:399 start_codon:yes stop_codon:yes gene_type:complete